MVNEAVGIPKRRVISPDQEYWVRARLETLVELAQEIDKLCRTGADRAIVGPALEVAIDATAIEILRTVGCDTGWVNLPRDPFFILREDAE